jgi:hypothetical protein
MERLFRLRLVDGMNCKISQNKDKLSKQNFNVANLETIERSLSEGKSYGPVAIHAGVSASH